MWMIHLEPRRFPNGEEHYPIDYYFDSNKEYEIAIVAINYAIPGENIFYTIQTNIIDYTIFNPEKIIFKFCEITNYQITHPIYYKIDVSSLKNFRIKVNGFEDRELSLSLAIREING